METGRLVVSKELVNLIKSARKQLGISTKGYLDPLKEICIFAIDKGKKNRKECKRVRTIIQETLVFLQGHCNEIDYINEGFFQGLIQFNRDLYDNKWTKRICIGKK